ncbi:uncharacterized protein FMAN_01602 [Fusarium mangiferae]|uniref:Uncharacterized protein n=1 Tax=Fusarium mangiferae TaxID=192010 RepID=A0A1L7SDM4_FUSMA|nr:uncharacterized protein FMAN_01602 [Fusarium mangiferae]CVK84651.1 uncharacterized protein FMAN_01602 [Fusarium mangiferae]
MEASIDYLPTNSSPKPNYKPSFYSSLDQIKGSSAVYSTRTTGFKLRDRCRSDEETTACPDAAPTKPYDNSSRWNRIPSRVEGADSILDNFIPDVPDNPRLKHTQEPRAWVSERHSTSHDDAPYQPLGDRGLNNYELYEALKSHRMKEVDSPPWKMYDIQRFVTFIVILSLLRYISNPNGASILALLRAFSPSQADDLRNLLANYLEISPTPILSLQFSQTTRFSICFNLPFLVVTSREYEDSRILTGNHYLRARYDFSLLFLETPNPPVNQKGNAVFSSGAILHQVVYSLLVTGHNSNYWVAVCLDEDFSGKELRLPHGNEGENNHAGDDPITSEPCLEVTTSPQAYSLTALTRQLQRIV